MNNEMTYDSSFCSKTFRRDRYKNQLGGKHEAWKKKSLFRGLHMHVTWNIGTDWIFAVPDFKITILKPVTFSLTEDVKLGFGTNKWRKNSSYEKDRTLRERSLHRQEIESRNANSSNLSRKFLWECKSHIPTKDLEHN